MNKKTIEKKLVCILLVVLLSASVINITPVQNIYAASSSSGTWIKESNGRWWYRHSDGSYTRYDWEYIDGSWYFFDSNGWMWTEWLKWENNWYYLNPSGVMHTGWLKDNGKWYYFTSRGIMVERWVKINGYWYYFEPIDGNMRTSPFTHDYRTYTFYSSGELMTTRILIDRQAQEKSYWCWAASSVMVGTYYTSSTVTQTNVVRYVKGSDVNEGGDSSEEVKAVNYASNGTKSSKYKFLFIKFDDLVDHIDNNHPFIMNMKWDGGMGHAVVGAGYDVLNEQIWIIDPWGSISSRFYEYDELMKGVTMASGTGHCSGIIVY